MAPGTSTVRQLYGILPDHDKEDCTTPNIVKRWIHGPVQGTGIIALANDSFQDLAAHHIILEELLHFAWGSC